MDIFHQIKEENDCDHIADNIFLGNIFSSHDNKLIGKKIFHLICLTTKIDFREPNVEYVHLPIADKRDANILPFCEEAYAHIETLGQKGGNVLVYCFAGKSRSATIVIYYFMKKYKMQFEEAHNFVKERRPCIELNSGFVAQLKLE